MVLIPSLAKTSQSPRTQYFEILFIADISLGDSMRRLYSLEYLRLDTQCRWKMVVEKRRKTSKSTTTPD
jgi:hypothetical protein